MLIDINISLIEACKEGALEKVKLLLHQGVNVNVTNDRGRTPLMLAACYKSSIKIVHWLLQCNANVNLIDELGRTALMEACNNGFFEKVKLLLDKGADVNIAGTESGTTALKEASYQGFDRIVRLLLDKNVDVNAIDKYGDTALIDACNVGAIEMRNGDIIVFHKRYTHCFKVAQLLLQHGADCTITNKKGKTALMVAGSRKAWEIVKLLSDYI